MKKFISLFLCTLLTGVIACGSDSYIAVSDEGMTWQDARDWCAARGGRLPLINNAESLGENVLNRRGTLRIDGVGKVNVGPESRDWTTSWDYRRLPGFIYWTGTVDAVNPGSSWRFSGNGGYVHLISNFPQGYAIQVVCVP